MSIQEMKSRLHQLIDSATDEPALEQLLDSAKQILTQQADSLVTLSELTDPQRQQLDRAMQDHEAGKTVSHEAMKQRHREWLNK